MKKGFFRVALLLLASCFFAGASFACSGYKVTVGGKTMMGANEDAWRTTPHIWFETATDSAALGAVFTGSRFDGANGYAPQSGMNEAGLSFQRLASPIGSSPKKPVGSKPIENPTQYLKDILHRCKTVEEVQAYIRQYRQSDFAGDVFLYVDQSGRYLTVEPYALTLGNESKYVISNFCPSATSPPEANRLGRYRNGAAFLQNKLDTSLEFCRALSDTMHVCRAKIGDGTLLTSIYDLNAGTVNLYFYHNYGHTVRFNLKEELQKGAHSLAVPTLFPTNGEFEHFRAYQTPQNNPTMLLFLLGSAGFLGVSSTYFNVRSFRKKSAYRFRHLTLIPACALLAYYLLALIRDPAPFFFAAPYKEPHAFLLNVASYLPFVLALALFPLGKAAYHLVQSKQKNYFAVLLLWASLLTVGALVGLFAYWGFYSVWQR